MSKKIISNSPETYGLEPCLEHPDYMPPSRKPVHFEDQFQPVGLLGTVQFLLRDKRLEDSIGEQYENSTSKRDSN